MLRNGGLVHENNENCKLVDEKKNKIKVHLEIGKKGHENNENWEITKIEDGGWKKKAVCKTARRAHS